MNRYRHAKIVALPLALLLATALAACGSKTPGPTNKRLADQGPCDLAKIEDLEKIFGPVNKNDPPHHEELQCFYFFKNGNVAIGRRADAARHGTDFNLDGVTARRYEVSSTCAIDVWLVPDDINQQFGTIGSVYGRPSCDVSMDVARLILNNLPG